MNCSRVLYSKLYENEAPHSSQVHMKKCKSSSHLGAYVVARSSYSGMKSQLRITQISSSEASVPVSSLLQGPIFPMSGPGHAVCYARQNYIHPAFTYNTNSKELLHS